ncbi:hypothetical protein Dvina_41290 [Dactylosporangium vinaceum]|uniref:Uncharacterized protein n=1 Tax=Dactylosporangium vinaceum TaxID=53362 RepID=A0ABV5MP54_9ACTN|nr:hypothetical protein [Dactylosporangium vinaceum]UAB94515.1 hypothetical protein Dvina_41290 [Dactylosporangium vinaceum]
MVRFKRRQEEEPAAPRPVRDQFVTRETAAGVFSRPPSTNRPVPPPVREEPATAPAPRLSVRPYRTPAPAVTRIRVEATPVDGFEYETAEPWQYDPPAPPPPAPPRLPPPPPPRPVFAPLAPKPPRVEPGTISWLDE